MKKSYAFQKLSFPEMHFSNHFISSGRLIILLAAILLPAGIFGQNGNIKFEHLGQEDGLNHPVVRKIVQDGHGFMWFATPDGVCKYDGYTFTRYRHDPGDLNSISANSVNDIFVDHSGTLWVGSFDGLDHYDRLRDTFVTYRHDPADPHSISANYVSAIGEDRSGTLWVGTAAGLSALKWEDRPLKKFTHYYARRGNPAGLGGSSISAIVQDPRPGNNAIWIGTRRFGVNKLDPETGRFLHVFHPNPQFHWMREEYGHRLNDLVDQLQASNALLGAVLETGDSLQKSTTFEIDDPTDILAVNIGEGWQGKMYDYGWLENAETGEVVWTATFEGGKFAGGHSKNRIEMAALSLAAGKYHLHYATDANHSYPRWNAVPPKRAAEWGIQIFKLTAAEAVEFERLKEDRVMHDFISGNAILSLYSQEPVGPNGQAELWVGTIGQGLNKIVLPATADSLNSRKRHYNDVDFMKVTTFVGDPKNPNRLGRYAVSAIIKSGGGNGDQIWAGTTSGGLFQIQQGNQTNAGADFIRYTNDISNPNSLSTNGIYSLHEDPSGNLWAGTNKGLNKLSSRRLQFSHFTNSNDPERQESSLPSPSVTAMYEDDDGFTWVGTSARGLSRFNPAEGTFMQYQHDRSDPTSAPYGAISAIVEVSGSNEALWLGTHGAGLSKFDKTSGTFTHFRPNRQNPAALTNNNIADLEADEDGNLWIGIENGGLNKFDPQTGEVTAKFYRPFHPDSAAMSPNYLFSINIWSLRYDPYTEDPSLWIGSVGGSLCNLNLKTEKFTHFLRDEDQPGTINNKSVTTIFIDREQTLWVGTYSGGLNKFDRNSGTFRHFTVKDGLANNMVCGILEDDFGNLWMSTNSGLSKFNIATETFKNYDVNDGLQSDLFNRGVFAKSRSGKMFFGGVNGFNCFHPDSLKDNLHPPQIVLTDFKIFDKSVANNEESRRPQLEAPVSDLEEISLNYAENFFSFEFVALDFTNPPKNEYAYRLQGFDPDWVYCGTRRYASYTNLDPGEYIFQVKGANSDGIWNEEGISVKIAIMPPFWKTWWFYLISFATLVAAAIGFHNYRVRVKINRMIEIERVRKKAAADFHDELGHKLTKISLFSEILRRKMNGGASEDVDYLNRINDISNGLYHGMRDFLWTLDPEKDSLYEVAVRLKDFGDEFFDKTGISFQMKGISGNLKALNLTMDWKRHIILIFKEAMNNILKHADCDNVMLEIQYKDGKLNVLLSDDGIGIPKLNGHIANGKNGHARNGGLQKTAAVKHHSGNGIKNMKTRANKLGGELVVRPNVDYKGTVVEFRGYLKSLVN